MGLYILQRIVFIVGLHWTVNLAPAIGFRRIQSYDSEYEELIARVIRHIPDEHILAETAPPFLYKYGAAVSA